MEDHAQYKGISNGFEKLGIQFDCIISYNCGIHYNRRILMKPKGPSKMAEGIAMHRAAESMLPIDERIFYDPYAVLFIDPQILKFSVEHPKEAKEKVEAMEKLFPGLGNSIRARVRYFDDWVEKCVTSGFTQFVILGAGYDTRPLRIESLRSKVVVFEVDHPDTQFFKKEKIREFFGSLPENVRYVPVDLEIQSLEECLFSAGYKQDQKTAFILEGLSMYLSPEKNYEIFTFISSISGQGSKMIFDYYPESVINGTHPDEIVGNIISFANMNGEPLKFGIMDNCEVEFLKQWRFEEPKIITSEEYRKLYFTGENSPRNVCSLLSFIEVMIL